MNLPLVFRAAARSEFKDAAAWFETQRDGLGTEFIAEVERVLDMIPSQPNLFPVTFAEARVTPVKKFPDAVYFRAKAKRIVIVAVFYTSQDPKVWKSRI